MPGSLPFLTGVVSIPALQDVLCLLFVAPGPRRLCLDQRTRRAADRQRGDSVTEQQAVLHGDGPGGEIAYRIAWARTYLRGMGLADNSREQSGR